ncbi:hypothetical protein HYH03_016746 [Edaphochlamys debaryana]|uniref:Uncharacterized protein n=1 Tax=Edaphochlamys debaryana TaxID=47281 RepID=A0A836BPK3_9CHLO|nr:hypothetical protein HYH03_016746 [Edaphochlamys debaryana]|eukprot:KAG2484436.1 hypothetical protein HYH03_016746 [Edaphochlamys debaryana]
MRATRLLGLAALAVACFGSTAFAESATYNGTDGHVYTLQTGLIGDMRTWEDAKSFCNGVQFNGQPSLLSPYRNPAVGDSENAVATLCARRTCWINEPTRPGNDRIGEQLCALKTALNEDVFQGCFQVVSFVCRSASPVNAVSTPAPAPSAPTAAPPTPSPSGDNSTQVSEGPARQKQYVGLNGRVYTLFFLGAQRTWGEAAAYCQAIGMEHSPYRTDLYGADSVYAVNLLCARSTRTTCWLGEEPSDDNTLCPMLDQRGESHFQDCGQPLAFVCRTLLGDSEGAESTPSIQPSRWQLAPVVVDSRLGSDGRRYVLYSGPDRNRRTHRQALDYCMSMGQEMASYMPEQDPASANAVEALCRGSGRLLTSWVFNPSVDGLCSVFSAADSRVYLQGCNQLVSWVCRTARPIDYPNLDGDEELPPVPAIPNPPATIDWTGPNDGMVYTLYNGDAPNRRNYTDAAAFCASVGAELSPFNRRNPDGDSVAAVRALCGGARTTCWVRERLVGSDQQFCPLVSQEVKALWQDCDQRINFVCRVRAPPSHRRLMSMRG